AAGHLADAARRGPDAGRRAVPRGHREGAGRPPERGDGRGGRSGREGHRGHGARRDHPSAGDRRHAGSRGLAPRELPGLRGPPGPGRFGRGDREDPERERRMNATHVLAEGATLNSFGHDPWWIIGLKALVIFVFLLLTVLITVWAERRIIGRMQLRPGP